MAKGEFIKILEILRGKVAGLVVRRRPDGTFIFSQPPTYKSTPSMPGWRPNPRQKRNGCPPTTLPLPTA
jgi:hypothetical protein